MCAWGGWKPPSSTPPLPCPTLQPTAAFPSPLTHPTPSRHPSLLQGKLFTEELLQQRGVNWTSVRPVYIYGPLNYNPVEEWFFHRLAAGRPIPVPGTGMQVTQLGHVKDLASAFVKVLGNPKAARQVYNLAGER